MIQVIRGLGYLRGPESFSMIILRVGPDVLRIEVGGKRATLPGRGMPSLNDVDFCLDRGAISHWEDGTTIPNAVREEIIANLPALAAAQRVRVTIG